MVEEVAAFQSLCASDGADYLSPIKCANITQAEYQLETGYPSKAIYYALESITDSDRNPPASSPSMRISLLGRPLS